MTFSMDEQCSWRAAGTAVYWQWEVRCCHLRRHALCAWAGYWQGARGARSCTDSDTTSPLTTPLSLLMWLQMIRNSRTLQVILAVDMVALLLYNVAGMMVTGQLGAVFRTVLETTRTLFVWLVSMAYQVQGRQTSC